MVELYLINKDEQPLKIELENGGIVTDMTYQLLDAEDITAGLDNVTKNIKIVGNKHNDNALGYMFSLDRITDNSSNKLQTNFSFTKQVDCIIYEDNELISKGLFQLLKSVVKNGVVEYDAVVVGYRATFFSKIKSKKISELSLSHLNHPYTALEQNNTLLKKKGYVYTMLDYGHGAVPELVEEGKTKTWDSRNMKPSLYISALFNQIFKEQGYNYVIDGYFKNVFDKLILPSQNTVITNNVLYSTGVTIENLQPWADFRNTGTVVKLNKYNADTNFYNTQSSTGLRAEKQMTLDISATAKFFDITTWGFVNNPSTAFIKYTVVCSVVKKVDETAEWEEIFSTKKNRTQKYSDTSEISRTDFVDIKSRITLMEGDFVGIKMSIENIDTSATTYNNGGTLPDHQVICRVKGDVINLGNGIEKNTQMELAEGDLLEFNNITLPATLQFDLIKEVMKLFNLVTYTNIEAEKTIHFCTYDEYFSKALPQNILNNAVDWSDKIDVSNYSIKPLTNISKKYKWTFAEGQDFLNTTYFEKYKEVYGTKDMDGIIDYKEDIKTIESSFVPTIMTKINDLDLPLIFKYNSDNLKESYSSELRILFYKGYKNVLIERGKWKKGRNNTYKFQHDGKWLFHAGEVTTLYADENDVSKNFDLTFGIPFEMYSQTTTINKNIYDKFYEKIIVEQNNRDIHILECSIYLNYLDISNLDLSVPVYISTSSGASYYKILKVDYSPASSLLSKVQLQKIII